MVLNTYICTHGRSATIYRICVCISLVVFSCIKAMNNKQCWLKHSSSQMHTNPVTAKVRIFTRGPRLFRHLHLAFRSECKRERTDLLQGLDLGVELVQLLLPVLQVSQQVLVEVLELHVALTHLWGLRQPASFAHYKRTQSITIVILGQI